MRMLGAFRRAADRVSTAFAALQRDGEDAATQAQAMAAALYFLHLTTDPATYKEPPDGADYTDSRFDWIGIADFAVISELVNQAISTNRLTEKESGN